MILGTFIILLQVLPIFRCSPTTVTGDPLQEQYGSLKHASILHRHGDRSPITDFPLNPHKNYPWPDGYGQLLNKGRRRLVEVGKWFRLRYGNFLNDTYTRRHTRVDSSARDRCIMSTLCFLYGFYPAVGEQIWIENEKWQPIPVYAIAAADDNKLGQSKKCKLLDTIEQNEATDPKYARTYDEYKAIIELIINETGIDVTNKTKSEIFDELGHLENILDILVENNLTLPGWTINVYPEPLYTILTKTIRSISFKLQEVRLRFGPFMDSVIADMDKKIRDSGFEQRLHIYSAHDVTISNIMVGLKVYDTVNPAYGSSLILELREKNSINYVTVSYRNDTSAPNARLLDIPGCGLTCTFQQFYDLVKPLIPEDWNSECESAPSSRS